MSLERFTRGSALRTALLFLLGALTGAFAFFAGAAGVVLRESPSRHAGGGVNRALLDLLDVSAYGAAAVAFLLVLLLHRVEPLARLQKGLALRLLAVLAAATFASHEVVTPQMTALRDSLPALVDLLPAADPGRRQWARLHAFSSGLLVVRVLVSAALFVLLSRRPRRTIGVAHHPAPPPEGPAAA